MGQLLSEYKLFDWENYVILLIVCKESFEKVTIVRAGEIGRLFKKTLDN